MVQAVFKDPAYRHVTDAEREAIRFLIPYLLTQAKRAERMSPVWRWWVGTAQIGKEMVYGQDTI
jgi:hypothetical protein